jgi:imidazolonepropionase-like amidohydrolase
MGRVFRYFSGVVSHGMDNVRAVAAAGGRLAVGNDCGPLPRTPAMVGLELALLDFALREGGARLPPAEALRAATLHGAEALGLADRAGAIAPGHAADLAVYDRDPLADFGVIGSPVAALFQGGRLAVNRCGL